nr:hypothetical protein [Tanacetum cinerariifolium]
MPCEALSKEISSSIPTFVSHTVFGWGIGTSKYWGVLRIFMISLRLIPLAYFPMLDQNFPTARRNLKLNDEADISSLPDAELFENLQLMGYNILPNQKFTFQKGQFSHQWKYLIHTIMQCLSPKRTPTEPHHTPSFKAQQTSPTTHSSPSLPHVPTKPLPTVILTDTPLFRHYTRRARIAQSLALSPVADEPASPIGDVSQGEACPTDSGLEADQDRANIPKTSTLPSDSTPRELEINSLKARIKLLEDKDRGVAEQSKDDTPIKGMRLDEGEEAAERVSNDTEEMATVLTSMDAANILSSRGVQGVPTATEVATATVSIPTGSGVVSTASPTIPTASPIFTTAIESTLYTRRKGKETMVEFETPKKKKVQEQIDVQLAKELEEEMARDAQRMNEQIARDVKIARIHAEEELHIMIDGLDRNNETVAKYLQEYHQFATELPIRRRIDLISDLQREFYTSVLRNKAGWKAKHFKGMTLEEIEEKFDPLWKQIQDFTPISSKEETERFKRKGLRLEQESVKKLKTSEEVKATEEVIE